ncbi:MAG: hypothetical protein OEM59_15420, partial [Rhodospirillales bacterium]|nr:hypothetical protein [Rhodospirillales bacterium]
HGVVLLFGLSTQSLTAPGERRLPHIFNIDRDIPRLRIRPLYGDDGEVMFYAGAQNPIEASEVRAGVIHAIED